jgi:iron-sulfur cluster assembly accessory protein
MITMTERAARKVQALAGKKGAPAVLRVKVGSGGCSGMSYEFQVAEQVNADDLVFEGFGAKAVVDPRSDFFIGGSEVDYVESLMQSGFVVQNPQATSSCSCGKSFST